VVQLEHWAKRYVAEPILIQLIPRRTVEPSGVADYALTLAWALRGCGGMNSLFLSATPEAQSTALEDEWETVLLPQRQPDVLSDTIETLSMSSNAAAVLLHYSGYGFQRRGVPFWLMDGLRKWKAGPGSVPLLTVCHELYATGRPWQSSFWLSPVQKWIARSIVGLSSRVIVPTKIYRESVLSWGIRRDSEVTCLPVFSNVGEPGCGLSPGARPAAAVVFGLAGVEDRVFGIYRHHVERILMALGIERVFDVGPRFSPVPSELSGIPLIRKGTLAQGPLSKLLQQTRFGLIAYPLHAIGKSGVFAAYAAHGVVPIVLSDKRGCFDGLEPGRHFLDGLRLYGDCAAIDFASIQHELSRWYASHDARVQADFIQQSIKVLQGAR